MSCTLLFFTVVLAAHSVLSGSVDDIKKLCNEETGFDGDIVKLSFNRPDISKEAKCSAACVLEKLDVFGKDGSIHKENLKKMVKETEKNETVIKKEIQAIDECPVLVKGNNCETAYEFKKCWDVKVKLSLKYSTPNVH